MVLLKKHVLVMSFIGEDMKPAPQLREAKLTQAKLESAYQQCIKVGLGCRAYMQAMNI